jgi:protein TonB
MKSLLIYILLLFPIFAIGQTNSKTDTSSYRLVPKPFVQQMPTFLGGDEALFNYIKVNLRYPEKAKQAKIQGTVFVTFLVKADGRLNNIKLLQGIGYGCDEEAIRLVQTMPNWKPAKDKGENVDIQMNLPIKFKLNN